MSRVRTVVAAFAALALAHSAHAADTTSATADDAAANKVVLQLNGPAQFEFAGYYAALWQGFYRDAGLDVDIKPGAGRDETPTDPVRAVMGGDAQFGVGTADLAVRAAQGQPLLLLAPIFQRSGAEIYYRAGDDYASPGALAKAKVGRLPASNILDIELATALKAEGIDPDKIDSVPLQPGELVTALSEKGVDAAPGSAWELPWLAHEKNLALKSINPADYRVEFYGDTLFTSQRFAAVQPDVVKRFRAASLKGWEYALQHSDDVARRITSDLPHPPGIQDVDGFEHYQEELAASLSRYPSVALGFSNPDRWNRIEAAMVGVHALLRTADASDFIYDPDATARRHNDMRSLALLGGAFVFGIVVLILLWRRWRRGTVAAAAQSAIPPQPDLRALVRPSLARPTPAAATPEPIPVKPESSPVKPEAAPADLNALLSRLERPMRQRVPRRVSFRLSLLPDLWRCRADPQIARALVLDLVAASADDLKGSGELIVGTRNYAFDTANLAATPGAQLGEYVRVTVRDNGPGLADDALERVFNPATTPRASAARAATALRAIGGFARVESAEGIGTAVHLYFPRAADTATGVVKPANAAE